MTDTKYRKKLIEVALPLEAINKASAREKSIRHGHPSTLHLWWARRPLAACRAVLFSSLVNDPEDDPMYGVDKEGAYTERAKLFNLIEDLVKWENSNNPEVINRARLEIARSIAANKVADKELADDLPLVANAPDLPEQQKKYLPDPPKEYTPQEVRFKMPNLRPEQVNHFLTHYAPPVLDPFAGGGSIPLEAQRLGLRAYASDLNPVPVLINKALIEIPPKFAGMAPVNPEWQKQSEGKKKLKVWNGAEGLAEDVRYYGKWMRDEAEKSIGHLYPKATVTQEMADNGRPDLASYVGQELTVIAWIWARTVASPNPAANGSHVPLVRSFWLSKKEGKKAWVEPIIDHDTMTYQFTIKSGTGEPRAPTIRRNADVCLLTNSPMPRSHIRSEAVGGRMRVRLMGIACEGKRERVFLPATDRDEKLASQLELPTGVPDTDIVGDIRYLTPVSYGMTKHTDLFTARQLVALDTFCDLTFSARKKSLDDSNGDEAYANAIATYLTFAIGKSADYWTSLAAWQPDAKNLRVGHLFTRQAISMAWDFGESNPLGKTTANFTDTAAWIARVIERLPASTLGESRQLNAADIDIGGPQLFSTDPPYYDNVPYADLSDFFYVWFRRCLAPVYPELLGTVLVPKAEELVADAFRQGSWEAARLFFEQGMNNVFSRLRKGAKSDYPTTIYYAFKQAEDHSQANDAAAATGTRSSTGWETFLQGLTDAGWQIDGTWPIRTELGNRLRSMGSNALASSIVLVCRARPEDASTVTRRDFANVLRSELPEAIKNLQSGNIAPVDLAQASIGPGMAVFSRYSKVVNTDGSEMMVREALQLINQTLDEALSEQESDFDSETRFALRWFEQYGMEEGPFGDAETLAKAMAVSVNGVVQAGVLASQSGKVRLLKREELNQSWSPATDTRVTIWECSQHLIQRLEANGESVAAELLAEIIHSRGSESGEIARELSYRLYSTCERKSWATEARSYNALVVSWPEISRLARDKKNEISTGEQKTMFDS